MIFEAIVPNLKNIDLNIYEATEYNSLLPKY